MDKYLFCCGYAELMRKGELRSEIHALSIHKCNPSSLIMEIYFLFTIHNNLKKLFSSFKGFDKIASLWHSNAFPHSRHHFLIEETERYKWVILRAFTFWYPNVLCQAGLSKELPQRIMTCFYSWAPNSSLLLQHDLQTWGTMQNALGSVTRCWGQGLTSHPVTGRPHDIH